MLLLDNHAAHVSLTAVEFCRDHGIVLLTIPPKTSHKLQPLDVAVYNPFKKNYADGIDAWHRNHQGQTMNIYGIPIVVNSAYIEAFALSNITNGFRACGIVPYDKDIIPDSDYSSSYVSDCPEPAVSSTNQIELNVESNCFVSTIPDLLPPTDSLVSSDADSSTADLQEQYLPLIHIFLQLPCFLFQKLLLEKHPDHLDQEKQEFCPTHQKKSR